MKTSDEMVSSLLERRDAYVARQKQKRRTVMKITSAACAFALVALVGLGVTRTGRGSPATPPVDTPVTTEPTEEKLDGTGGDEDMCTIHSLRYHAIPGSLLKHYPVEPYAESDDEDYENIVGYVEYYSIPREEFVELMNWDAEKLDELVDDREGKRYCPYTYNQYLDAIYGDDAELAAWVFASERTWPEQEEEPDVEDPVIEEPAE